MIEQWEAREWAQRAEEIRGVQEQRLGLLEKALQVRLHIGWEAKNLSGCVSGRCVSLHNPY
jgi:hypothetical protein